MEDEWIRTKDEMPPHGVVVETKIDDEMGERNIQLLKRRGISLFYFPDDSMYVYYTPSHWRFPPSPKEDQKQ